MKSYHGTDTENDAEIVGKKCGESRGHDLREGRHMQAQELAYDAMERPDLRKAADLARKALALDPDCIDALYILALKAPHSRPEQIKLLEHAVAVAEQNLGGPSYFEKHRGEFWGLLETRPYMRARTALADLFRECGDMVQAIGHFEALLDLNCSDNLDIRSVLIGLYFQVGNRKGVRRLLRQHRIDDSAIFWYARVLEHFLAGRLDKAADARREAQRANPHAEAYLTEWKCLPCHLPDSFSPGDEREAIYCAIYLGDAWQQNPQAVSWLKSSLAKFETEVTVALPASLGTWAAAQAEKMGLPSPDDYVRLLLRLEKQHQQLETLVPQTTKPSSGVIV